MSLRVQLSPFAVGAKGRGEELHSFWPGDRNASNWAAIIARRGGPLLQETGTALNVRTSLLREAPPAEPSRTAGGEDSCLPDNGIGPPVHTSPDPSAH